MAEIQYDDTLAGGDVIEEAARKTSQRFDECSAS